MSIYHLPTYSIVPWNSKLVWKSELWQAEISSASVKSLVNPSCNRADQLKGSISNSLLHSAQAPFWLLQAWQHLLSPVWEWFYFSSPVRLCFHYILWPFTPCQQLPAFQYWTWNTNWKDEAACAPSLPADGPSSTPTPPNEAGGVPLV